MNGPMDLNKRLIDFELKLKKVFSKISLDNVKDILHFMISHKWESIIFNKELSDINFYSSIFVVSNLSIESKFSYYKDIKSRNNGYIFFKKKKSKLIALKNT